MYRRIRGVKADLEKPLGLGELAIRSTIGMTREHDEVAEGIPKTGKSRLSTINFQLRALLLLIALFATAGTIYALYEAFLGPPPASNNPPSPKGG
jgi:hypothetical protein